MTEHTIRGYEYELMELRERLTEMTELVRQMISNGRQALAEGDVELAKKTIEIDHQVNRAEVDIDRFCFDILVRRQSVASDLRFILAAMKMVTDVERIGDLAVSICYEAVDAKEGMQSTAPAMLSSVADASQQVVGKAIDAFLEADVDLAFEVIDDDEQVNDHYHALNRQLLTKMADGDLSVDIGIGMQNLAKRFERMGDCATNIAEAIIFALEAQDIRHRDKLSPMPD